MARIIFGGAGWSEGVSPEIQLAKDVGFVLSTFHDATATPHPSHIGVFNDALGYKVPDLSVLVLALIFQIN